MTNETETQEYNGQELVEGKISYVYPENGNLKFVLDMPDGNVPMLTVYLRKFDENAPKNQEDKYKEDAETFDAAMDRLHEMGVAKKRSVDLKGGKASDLSDDDYNALTEELMDKTVEVYYNDNKDGSFDTPVASFKKLEYRIKYTSITKDEYAHFDDMLGETIELLPITEFPGQRFLFGFETEVDGEKKNVKISQFVLKDGTKVSGKYANNATDNMWNSIKKGEENGMDASKIENLKKVRNKQVKLVRENKIKELKEKLGIDVDELMASKEPLKAKIKNVDTSEFNGTVYLVLQARLED